MAQQGRTHWARGRRPDNSVMNSSEKSYSLELQRRKDAGEIVDFKFHAMTLTIANPPNAKDARWTPDFCVWDAEMILGFHDVKGFMVDAALVRMKVAASQYPHPIFVAKKRTKKEQAEHGGEVWEVTEL